MLTVISFIVALAILIAVHEYGHYRVAVACGVKVLRFSIGFGKPLLVWRPKKQHPGQDTEFVLAAFPLGGYVKMLDEREAPVPPELKQVAFNTQPLKSRAAIVVAGPMANLLLAVVLYAIVNWMGVAQPRAVLASPQTDSIAYQAGLRGGEVVLAAGFAGDTPKDVVSMEDVRWITTQGALDKKDVHLAVGNSAADNVSEGGGRHVILPLASMEVREADAQMFRKIGVGAAWTQPLIGETVAGSAAEVSGLKKDDLVLSIAGKPVLDGFMLREAIRASVRNSEPLTQPWQVRRQGQTLQLEVTPQAVKEGAVWVGKIGAFVGSMPEMVQVRYGPIDGLWRGIVKTWEISTLTLRMMGKMVIGEASLKNLSGPLTIADVAGKSASLGFVQYLLFLALISVSLGVLNLLPLPVLDGGHLMYYAWEAVTGKEVTQVWLERLQHGGVAILFAMMAIAMFNDVTRIWTQFN
jgi:regulator of sigma E protease